MDSARWERIKEVFSSALELSGEEQAQFIDAAATNPCMTKSSA